MKVHNSFFGSSTEFIMGFITVAWCICLVMAIAMVMDSQPKIRIIGCLIGAAVLLIIDAILLSPYLYV
jgi:hypothetical protein